MLRKGLVAVLVVVLVVLVVDWLFVSSPTPSPLPQQQPELQEPQLSPERQAPQEKPEPREIQEQLSPPVPDSSCTRMGYEDVRIEEQYDGSYAIDLQGQTSCYILPDTVQVKGGFCASHAPSEQQQRWDPC